MTKVELVCSWCGRKFFKPRNEYNRRIRLGSNKFYCSKTCGGLANKINMKEHLGVGKPQFLPKDSKKDQYSPFRTFMKILRARNKRKGWKTDLTLPFLKELWDSQNGICPLTGWTMELPETSLAWQLSSPTPRRASIDRIDHLKPYMKNNIRFVSYMGNLCRHTFDDDEVRLFAESVMKHVSKTKDRNG